MKNSFATTVGALVEMVEGQLLQGEVAGKITGFAALLDAENGDLSFFHNKRYLADLERTRAGAVLVPREGVELPAEVSGALIAVENPSLAFSQVMDALWPAKPSPVPGIAPSAVVEDSAQLGANVSIGPLVYVGADVVIGEGTIVEAQCHLGAGVRVGQNSHLHPRVTIAHGCILGNRVVLHSGTVVGSDGFGFEEVEGRRTKIPQRGIVQIDDDVEIGANCAIDRARFGRTWIGEGTIMDNLIQIGHNVVIGKHCVIVSQVGISGSTTLGNRCMVGGQVGFAGHLRIADGVVLAGKTGVTKDIPEPGYYMGFPVEPAAQARRNLVSAQRIPRLVEKVRQLEKRLAQLEGGE